MGRGRPPWNEGEKPHALKRRQLISGVALLALVCVLALAATRALGRSDAPSFGRWVENKELAFVFAPSDCSIHTWTVDSIVALAARLGVRPRIIMIEPPTDSVKARQLALHFYNGDVVIDHGDRLHRVLMRSGLRAPLILLRADTMDAIISLEADSVLPRGISAVEQALLRSESK